MGESAGPSRTPQHAQQASLCRAARGAGLMSQSEWHCACVRRCTSATQIRDPATRLQQAFKRFDGRAAVYEMARQTHPQRWSKQCRNWRRIDQIHLNPDTPQTKEVETLKKTA